MNKKSLLWNSFLWAFMSITIGQPQAIANTQANSYVPIYSFVRISNKEAADPSLFIKKLKNNIVLALKKDRLMQPGYPKPCRFNSDAKAAQYCLTDANALLATADALLLNSQKYHLRFSVVNFPSSMPFEAQIYIVPEKSYADFLKSDATAKDQNYQRILVLGAIPTSAIHRAVDQGILNAGAIAEKR
jgi:hypothetical protein